MRIQIYDRETQKTPARVLVFDSPIGAIAVGCAQKALLWISTGFNAEKRALQNLDSLGFPTERGTNAVCKKTQEELMDYFVGKRKTFRMPIALFGTPFQIHVWQTLCEVPYGHVVTYGELAALAGYPNAARAVGTAMAKNRIPIIIPCHRVIATGGKLGGYGGGLGLKRTLLEIENAKLSV